MSKRNTEEYSRKRKAEDKLEKKEKQKPRWEELSSRSESKKVPRYSDDFKDDKDILSKSSSERKESGSHSESKKVPRYSDDYIDEPFRERKESDSRSKLTNTSSQDRGRTRDSHRNSSSDENVYDKIKKDIIQQDEKLAKIDRMLINSQGEKDNSFVADRLQRGRVSEDQKSSIKFKTRTEIITSELGENYSKLETQYFKNTTESTDRAKEFMSALLGKAGEDLSSDENKEVNIALVPIEYTNKNGEKKVICLVGISGKDNGDRQKLWTHVKNSLQELNKEGKKYLLVENYNHRELKKVFDYLIREAHYKPIVDKNCSERKLLHFIFKLNHYTGVTIGGWTNCVLGRESSKSLTKNEKSLLITPLDESGKKILGVEGKRFLIRDCCLNCQKAKPAAISYLRYPTQSQAKYKRELSPLRKNISDSDFIKDLPNTSADDFPNPHSEKKEKISNTEKEDSPVIRAESKEKVDKMNNNFNTSSDLFSQTLPSTPFTHTSTSVQTLSKRKTLQKTPNTNERAKVLAQMRKNLNKTPKLEISTNTQAQDPPITSPSLKPTFGGGN